MQTTGVDALQAKMLAHVLSRCRKGCRGSRACAEYQALQLEYRSFLRGESAMNDKPHDPVCICGDPASMHHNGHGSCSALKTETQLCGCPTFKLAPHTLEEHTREECNGSCDEHLTTLSNYEPEPENEE